MSIHPATDEIIAFLNSLVAIDPDAVTALIDARVHCNPEMALHPSVQVHARDGEPSTVGILGILNGFCGTIDDGHRKGWGPITAVTLLEPVDGRAKLRIVGFRRTESLPQ